MPLHTPEDIGNGQRLFYGLKIVPPRLPVAVNARVHFLIAGLGRGDEEAAVAEAPGHGEGKIALARTSAAAD